MAAAEPYSFDASSIGSGFGSLEPQRRFKHPYVTFFHLAFRSGAILTYLLCTTFSDSFIGSFVAVVLFLSLDFWTVKNVSGRIMVGLRWWNYINAEGKSEWIFEARNGNSQHLLSTAEVRVFWTSLVLAPALWLVFFLTALARLRLAWLVLVVIGLTLTATNMFGYLRCKYGTSSSLRTSVTDLANSYMQQRLLSGVMGAFSKQPAAAAAASPQQTHNVV